MCKDLNNGPQESLVAWVSLYAVFGGAYVTALSVPSYYIIN